MKGLERYETLKAAVNIIATGKDKLLGAGDFEAWKKLNHATEYLRKQQAHAMEGRTEDGKENEANALEIMWKAVAAGEPVGKRCCDEWEEIAAELDSMRLEGHCGTVFPTPMLTNPHREETLGGGRGRGAEMLARWGGEAKFADRIGKSALGVTL